MNTACVVTVADHHIFRASAMLIILISVTVIRLFLSRLSQTWRLHIE